MGFYIRSALAAALIAGGIVAAAFSISEISKIGSCGNGQVVINRGYSSKPCPEGTGTLIVTTAGGIIAGVAGVFLFALKGSRPGKRRGTGPSPVPAVMGAYSGSTPTTTGPPPIPGAPATPASPASPAYTPPQPTRPPPSPAAPASTPTATPAPSDILPTMPSVPPVPGISTPPPSSASPGTGSAAAGSTEDPVEQLAKLDKLREQGVLSESEFAEAKRRVLGDL